MLNTACPKLRIAGTVQDSIVDGPGIRFVIFTQGCPHHCPGCHNPQTHDFAGGYEVNSEELIQKMEENPLLSGVTFSGGEPFCQAEALVPIAEAVKAAGKHLMVYTGYLYEQLLAMKDPFVQRLLELADVLVDGPFILAERNLTLQYRGSENQRVIDLKKTKEAGEIVLYRSESDRPGAEKPHQRNGTYNSDLWYDSGRGSDGTWISYRQNRVGSIRYSGERDQRSTVVYPDLLYWYSVYDHL